MPLRGAITDGTIEIGYCSRRNWTAFACEYKLIINNPECENTSAHILLVTEWTFTGVKLWTATQQSGLRDRRKSVLIKLTLR